MPRILIFTGDGKGKTTAALGMLLRATGHDHRAYVMQFLKNDATVGEVTALRKLPGVSHEQCGRGFVPKPDSPAYPRHRDAAQAGLVRVRQRIAEAIDDLIILDEICGAVHAGLVSEDDVLSLARDLPEAATLVLTGRNATAALINLADTVSEMRPLKHGYDADVKAQAGVEF